MVHSGVYKMKEDVLFVSRFVLMSQLETDAKKLDWLKSWPLVKFHNSYPIKLIFKQLYLLMS